MYISSHAWIDESRTFHLTVLSLSQTDTGRIIISIANCKLYKEALLSSQISSRASKPYKRTISVRNSLFKFFDNLRDVERGLPERWRGVRHCAFVSGDVGKSWTPVVFYSKSILDYFYTVASDYCGRLCRRHRSSNFTLLCSHKCRLSTLYCTHHHSIYQ